MKRISRSLMILGVASMLFAVSPEEDTGYKRSDYKNKQRTEARIHKNIFEGINLSEEQEIKIKEVFSKYKKYGDEQSPKITSARRELTKELDSKQPSEERIKQLKKDILDVQEKRLDDMINMKKEINSILTAEQIAKLEEIKAERIKDMKKRDRRKTEDKKQGWFKK